ncbi:hypothetical protein [Clostridium beijerinckii]|uniref:hypothetical protein n=1 Tax=Clostridium beijerinckii TaxID=1520 RepID=UPI00098C7872|nr:hypothetical protein [Clostridium beijerinckii]NRT76336.1 hypothetical protein [Clostridium beijerinckii]OOM48627.1 hypothetical protein CBEIJ_20990 [Clostridium beijerinckii]
MDLKLKDILAQIKTCQILRINHHDSGEEFYPNYSDLKDYGEYYIIDIAANKEELEITMQSQI